MKLEEKIEKELKGMFPSGRTPHTDSWRWGFREGFRRGYNLASEEAAGGFKKIQERTEEVRIKAENMLKGS